MYSNWNGKEWDHMNGKQKTVRMDEETMKIFYQIPQFFGEIPSMIPFNDFHCFLIHPHRFLFSIQIGTEKNGIT